MAGIYGDVLGSGASIETRAHDLLDTLATRAESSASAICLWDPIQRRHIGVANHDYPSEVMDHFNNWFVDNDPLFDSMRVHGLGALRWRDFPDYRGGYSVNNVFRPAGFDEGLSARLITRDGTYVGLAWSPSSSPRTRRLGPSTASARPTCCGAVTPWTPRWTRLSSATSRRPSMRHR